MSISHNGTINSFYSRTTNLPPITTFTMMGWFRSTGTGAATHLFLGSGSRYAIEMPAAATTLNLVNSLSTVTGKTSITAGIWHHLALVCSGTAASELRVFLNGKVECVSAGNAAVTSTTMRWCGAPAQARAGNWAAIKIYDRALTETQIQAEMSQVMPVSIDNLNAYYPLFGVNSDEVDFLKGRIATVTGSANLTQGNDNPPIPLWAAPLNIWIKAASTSPQTLTPGAAITTWTVPAPTIIKNVTVAGGTPPKTTWTVPTVTMVANRTLSAGAALTTWTVPSVSVVPGMATISAGASQTTWTVPTASIGTGGTPQTLTPGAASTTWTVPTSVVGRTVAANAANTAWTVPSAVVVPGIATISASAAVTQWVVPAVSVNGISSAPQGASIFGRRKMTRQ